MFSHILDFIVDFFTNLNTKKIIGAGIAAVGLFFLGRVQTSSTTNQAVLFAIIGILVGGIGFVIIYYDMANDKNSTKTNELEAMKAVHDYKSPHKPNNDTWHMEDHHTPKDS